MAGKRSAGPTISDPVSLVAAKIIIDIALAATSVLFFAAVLDTQALHAQDSGWWFAGSAIALIARLSISRFARRHLWANLFGSAPARSAGDGEDKLDEFIVAAQAAVLARYPDHRPLENLFGLLVDPSGFFDRVKEHVEIDPNGARKTTTFLIRADSTCASLIPIFTSRKRALIDDMRLQVDGSAASTLPYLENQGALLHIIDGLFALVYGTVPAAVPAPSGATATENPPGQQPPPAAPALAPEVEAVKKRVKRVVASPRFRDSSQLLIDLLALQLPQAATTGGAGATDARTLALRDALVNLTRMGSRSYFLLCVVPPADKAASRKVTVTNSVGPTLAAGKPLAWLRTLLGLNQREHVFYLQRATETVSYHFTVQAPAGMYIYRRKFSHQDIATGAPTVAMPLPAAGRRPLLPDRAESRSPSMMHVYLRDAVDAADTDGTRVLTLGVSLRERPPGLLEAGLLISFYLTVTIWTVGYYHDTVFGVTPPPGTWPTVLFGIPTLLSGWLVSRINAGALQRLSLLSLFMAVSLAAISAAAVLAAAFKSGHVELTDTPLDLRVVDLSHPVWGMLMLATALHLALSIVFVAGRAGRYWYATRTTAAE